MNLRDISHLLSSGRNYSCWMEDDVLYIKELKSESEYSAEVFGHSLQIRQAVCFDCFDFTDIDLTNIYQLCSMMNERFSGCKSYIDKWGALLTAADILEPAESAPPLEVVLNQVEFISLAMLSLVKLMRNEGRIVTREEIDEALVVPPLQ